MYFNPALYQPLELFNQVFRLIFEGNQDANLSATMTDIYVCEDKSYRSY